jgi:hypothetical protein
LHAHLQDLAFQRLKSAEKVFQLVEERHGHFRSRIAAEELEHLILGAVALVRLQVEVAFAGLVKGDLAQRLVDGDAHQQFAEVVGLLDVELAGLEALEERAEDRLHDVFGVHTAGQALAEAQARERQQTIDVMLKELSSGVLVPVPAAVHQQPLVG